MTDMFRIEITYSMWSVLNMPPTEVRQAVDSTIDYAQRQFGKLTGSWKAKHQPKWRLKRKFTATKWSFEMSTTTPIPVYLFEGTEKRYARLSSGYSRKSRPGRFGKVGSGGKVVARGKRQVPESFAREHAIPPGNWHYRLVEDDMLGGYFSERLVEAMAQIGHGYSKGGKRTTTQRVRVF